MIRLAGTSYAGEQYYITYKVNEYLPDGDSERTSNFINTLINKNNIIMNEEYHSYKEWLVARKDEHTTLSCINKWECDRILESITAHNVI